MPETTETKVAEPPKQPKTVTFTSQKPSFKAWIKMPDGTDHQIAFFRGVLKLEEGTPEYAGFMQEYNSPHSTMKRFVRLLDTTKAAVLAKKHQAAMTKMPQAHQGPMTTTAAQRAMQATAELQQQQTLQSLGIKPEDGQPKLNDLGVPQGATEELDALAVVDNPAITEEAKLNKEPLQKTTVTFALRPGQPLTPKRGI